MRPTRPTTWSKEGAPSASGASRSFGGWKGKADDGRRPSPPDPLSQSWERGNRAPACLSVPASRVHRLRRNGVPPLPGLGEGVGGGGPSSGGRGERRKVDPP